MIIARAYKQIIAGLLLLAACCAHAETSVTYYIQDGLGSPIAAMDDAGGLIWQKHYHPYGNEYGQDPGATDEKIGFTGHVQDASTGLTYMGARYYDPKIGRFMGVDSVGFSEDNPMSFNRYAYANNNPYGFVDPSGRIAILAAVPWIVGTVSAALTGYEFGTTGYDLYTGSISTGDLAGDVGIEIATNTVLKALPGGLAISTAKKLGIDTYLKSGTELFRVHGPFNKGVEGESWTTVDPLSVDDFRASAGLPDVNTGEYLIRGDLKSGTFAGTRKALPLGRNPGGMPETILKDADKKVNVREHTKLAEPL